MLATEIAKGDALETAFPSMGSRNGDHISWGQSKPFAMGTFT